MKKEKKAAKRKVKELVPEPILSKDQVCLACVHPNEKHYGSDDLQCNHPGCECVKFA